MECPKCKYVRIVSDSGPSYECPKCGIIYAKFDPAVETRDAVLRAKMADRMQKSENLLSNKSKNDDNVIVVSKFHKFINSKSLFIKFYLLIGVIALAFLIFRFLGEVSFWIVFTFPIIFLLLQKTDVKKVTSCPACKGLVAYGIKLCPHCGENKPAPKPVGKSVIIIAWIFIGVIIFIGSKSSGNLSSPSNPDLAKDSAIRLGAQATIQAAGYRCDAITDMTKLMIGYGFSVHCDNYRYNYSIKDEGGLIHVRLD